MLDLRRDIFERLDKISESSQAEIEHLKREIIRSQLELKAEIKGLSKRLSSVEQSGELHREAEAQMVREDSKLSKKVEEALSVQWNTTGLLHLGIKDLQKQMALVLEKLPSGCTTRAETGPSATSDFHSQK